MDHKILTDCSVGNPQFIEHEHESRPLPIPLSDLLPSVVTASSKEGKYWQASDLVYGSRIEDATPCKQYPTLSWR